MTVKTLCEKLSESIVGVLGNIGDRLVISSLIRLGYRGDSFLGIILVGESSAIGEKDLAYKLSRGSRINLYVAIISFLYLKVKKTPHLIRSAEKKLLLIKNIVLYD